MYQRLLLLVEFMCLLGHSLAIVANSSTPEEQFEDVLQAVTNYCYGQYSPGCVQFEFLTQLDRLLTTTDYEVFPSVYLSRRNASSPVLPPGLSDTLGRELDTTTRALNSILAERMYEQLRTWSISVHVFGNSTLEQFRQVMDLYLLDQPGAEVETGRKSKFWKYMGSALLTLAFSVISALISKSLTISIIALALTLLGNAGNNFGFGSPAAHAVHYRSPPPVRAHAPEVQYIDDLPDDGGAQPYVYVNRKSWKTGRSDDYYDKFYNKYYEYPKM